MHDSYVSVWTKVYDKSRMRTSYTQTQAPIQGQWQWNEKRCEVCVRARVCVRERDGERETAGDRDMLLSTTMESRLIIPPMDAQARSAIARRSSFDAHRNYYITRTVYIYHCITAIMHGLCWKDFNVACLQCGIRVCVGEHWVRTPKRFLARATNNKLRYTLVI